MSAQRRTNPRSPDPNTLANVLDFATTSTELNYQLSFRAKELEGVVQHTLQCTADLDSDGAVTEELWLDSSHVAIAEVSVDGEVYSELGEGATKQEKGWKLEARVQPYGSRLRIIFGKKYGQGDKVEIKVCATTESMSPSECDTYQPVVGGSRSGSRLQRAAQHWDGWMRNRPVTSGIRTCVSTPHCPLWYPLSTTCATN